MLNRSLYFLKTVQVIIGIAFLVTMCRSAEQESGDVWPESSADHPDQFLIKNALVVDGSGDPAFEADLFIKDGEIAKIFRRDADHAALPEVDIRIDAAGSVVAPGFIDIHSHGNPISTPEFENFISMGVTTISLGQDGRSPDSGDAAAWMDRVDATGTAVNVLHFVGHRSLRRFVDAPPETGLSSGMLREMQQIVEKAMQDGSFGLTTGIEYNPGYHADMEELAAVAEPVARHGGLVMSHMRSEDDDKIEDAIRELLEQGKRSGARVHVSHIKIVFGSGEERAGEVMSLLHDARGDGITVTADLYPYTASFTGIGIVFPDWALSPNDFDSVRTHRREELEAYLNNRIMMRNGPEATLFGTEPWSGMTLAEVADSLGKSFEDVLIDDIGPGGASAAYFVMDEDVVRGFLKDPLVMISSDGSPGMRHPRGYGSFAKIIRKYVVEEELLSLEDAIYKMTGQPASILGLDDPGLVDHPRGRIKEGYAADLVIFDPFSFRDMATFENPHQKAEGMAWVFVAGKPVIAGGAISGIRPTGVIRRKTIN